MNQRTVHRLRVPAARMQAGRMRLEGAELHYLRDVLRLRRGARVEVFDGEGRSFEAELAAIGPGGADLVLRDASPQRHESALELTLAVAVAKAAKLDWVVEKATELGVTRIIPFACERAIAAIERGTSRIERWRRIAAAAAAQCGRVRCPEVLATESFAGLMPLAASHDRAVLFAARGRESLEDRDARAVRSVVVATGPEGGFSTSEVTQAGRAGFSLVTLGPRVLRAETAAIVAVALAQHRWGDLRPG
ncbi:MAG TPA: 16S rRNA (uracil(1498)-N(3))-methyltransferase [Stellaceae bacterium]|nr:16S rRNA (uracil(1498)-N(3))-methyltransferase [Stellaceae bacterium]